METDKNGGKAMLFLVGFVVFFVTLSLLPSSWFKIESKDQYTNTREDDSLSLINKKLTKDYLNAPSDVSKADSLPNWKKALYDSVDQNIITATRTQEDIERQKDLDDPNNLTSQVSKNAYTISTYLAQQGNIDKKDIDTVTKNIVNNSLASSPNKNKTYTINDFKTTSKNDRETIRKYGNDLATNLHAVFLAGNKENLEILNDYLNTEDATILKKFDGEIKAFTKLRESLLKMTVPTSMAEMHVKELNIVEAYLNTIIIFSRTNRDPLRTVVTIEEYKNNLKGFYKVLKDYNWLFIEKNVFFTEKEKGYIFFNERMAKLEEK